MTRGAGHVFLLLLCGSFWLLALFLDVVVSSSHIKILSSVMK